MDFAAGGLGDLGNWLHSEIFDVNLPHCPPLLAGEGEDTPLLLKLSISMVSLAVSLSGLHDISNEFSYVIIGLDPIISKTE